MNAPRRTGAALPPETHPTALELRDALRRGEVSAVALVRDALERAAADDLGAFVSLQPEAALAEAHDADVRIAATPRDERGSLPPLLGLPTAHKDLVDVRGAVTTHGSRAVPHAAARHDAPVAAAVRTAGAVSIGKTQVPEFGIAGYSENLIAPPARNPHDPSRTPGGSSGGSAAAVAAGLIPLGVGSDGGGSIRIPSAACGLVGLKPGRGAVPADRGSGLVDEIGAPRLTVSGPIARTPADAALLFDALRGLRDEPSLAAVRRAGELRGLRIGVTLRSPFEGEVPIAYSKDAAAALDAAVARLGDAGHRIEEAQWVPDPRYPGAFTDVWTAGLARIDFAPGAEDLLGELAAAFLARARRASPERLASAARTLREIATSCARQWGAYDAILTPALAFAAPRVGAFTAAGPEGDYRLQCEWAPQTSIVNVAGLPAVVAPTHRDAAGLPFGVQLVGRVGAEATLLQIAEQLALSVSTR